MNRNYRILLPRQAIPVSACKGGKKMPLSSLMKAVKLRENKCTLKYPFKYVRNLTVSESTQHYKVAMACRYWLFYSEAFLILKWCTIVAFLPASTNISSMLQDRWMNGRERDKVMFSDQEVFFFIGQEELLFRAFWFCWNSLGMTEQKF